MSVTTTGFAPCEKGDRYLKQLVSHWQHKMPASYEDSSAAFEFPDGTKVAMQAEATGITITLTAANSQIGAQKRGVIERHIDRFAFREAPLNFTWQEEAA